MGRYTQEEETLIVKTAKELTATIEAEEMWNNFEINDKVGEKFWSYLKIILIIF